MCMFVLHSWNTGPTSCSRWCAVLNINRVLWAELIVVQDFQELVIYLQHLPTGEWGAGELDTLLSKVKSNHCLMAAMIM